MNKKIFVILLILLLAMINLVSAAQINSTSAEGLIVYEELEQAEPRYRLWNDSLDFTAELQAPSVGVDGSNDIRWNVVRGNHERDEIILATVDVQLDINVQIYDGSSWGNLLEVTTTNENSGFRGFDIGIEDISGDAIILYENSNSGANDDIAYRIWNGTGYSSEQTIITGLTNDEVRWIRLIPREGTDEIMALILIQANDLRAVLWNGTAFDVDNGFTLSTGVTSSNEQHFDFAWESTSGDGFIVYGEGNNIVYRDYTRSTQSFSGETTIGLGHGLDAARLCSDPSSDHIGLIWQDNGNDVQVRMWDGSSILSSPPSQDGQTEQNGANNANFDCTWSKDGSYAIFGFTDNNGEGIDYVNFTKSNTWSSASLTSTFSSSNFASNDIRSMRFVENPVNDQFMVIAMDTSEDVNAIRWDGISSFVEPTNPLETGTDVSNGGQESAQFDWYRYDPKPLVFNVTPANEGVVDLGVSVNITANVTDNIAVDTVFVNVTLPNLTVRQFTMQGPQGDIYNLEFNETNAGGNYEILIIANDTSVHQNINNTVSWSFMAGGMPNVTGLVPVANSSFDLGEQIEIAANASDPSGISSVVAQILLPNGTTQELTLSNVVGDKYNNSYTIPIAGIFNVTYLVNNTGGISNNTEKTFFKAGTASIRQIITGTASTGTGSTNLINFTDGTGGLPLLDTSKAIHFISYNHTFSSDHADTFRSSAIVSPTQLEIYGSTASANNNLSFAYTIVEFSNSTAIDVQRSNISLTTSPTLPQAQSFTNVGDSSSAFLIFHGHHHDATETTIGCEEFDRVRILNSTAWEVNKGCAANSGPEELMAEIVDVNDAQFIKSVQRGVTTLGTSASGVNVSPSTPVNRSNSLLFVTHYDAGNFNTPASDIGLSASLNSSGDIVISRGDSSANNNIEIAWEVVEFHPGFLSVQHLEIDVDSFSGDGTITSVDVNKSAALGTVASPFGHSLGKSTSSTAGGIDEIQFFLEFENSTTVRATRGDSSGSGVVGVQVISIDAADEENPRVQDIVPSIASAESPSTDIEIGANITDNIGVNYTSANITYPNGTIVESVLSYASGNFYNASFTIPPLNGRYNLSFFANDTSGNTNSTETSYFEVSDTQNPLIQNLSPSSGSSFDVSNNIEIGADLFDDVSVDNVSVVIDYPNGSSETIYLHNETDSVNYNYSFTIPSLIGRYNLSFTANDSSGNQNSSETSFFTVNDVVNPQVRSPMPSGSAAVGSSVEISANVTDDVEVSNVSANITYPNGTVEVLYLHNASGTVYNSSFTVPSIIGSYEVLIVANDSSGNLNTTESSTFTGTDSVNPLVFNIAPGNGTSYNISDSIEVSVNVTDNVEVSNVSVNVSYPNGTSEILYLHNESGQKFNVSFIAPINLGEYTLNFSSNDTSGNENNTVYTIIVVADNVDPRVESLIPIAGTTFSFSDTVEIGANVSDEAGVSNVTANLTSPDGNVTQINLSLQEGTFYNSSYVVPVLAGRYNLTFFANDSNGNTNTTEASFFLTEDDENPLVFDLLPVNSTNYEVGDSFEIGANVTDNGVISLVSVNISQPNGTLLILNLSLASGNKYNNSYDVGDSLGQYNITFIAEDGEGNLNFSENTSFIVVDTVIPSVFDLLPTENQSFNPSQSVEISANVTDNAGVSNVSVNISYPNGTIETLYLNNEFGNKYNVSFTTPEVTGQYNLSFYANDTNANENTTETSYFQVEDSTNPIVFALIPSENSNFSVSSSIEISANVTDNVAVSNVSVNISYPNGTVLVLYLHNETGSKFNGSFSIPAQIGRYNLSFTANDTLGNLNSSETSYFNAVDSTNPEIINISPANAGSYNVSDIIAISANVTDNVEVDFVRANISIPNGTNQTIELSNSSGIQFNNTYVAPGVLGSYEIIFFANDTSDNRNSSVNISFSVEDTINPQVRDLSPSNGTTFNVSDVIVISANITDNFEVSNGSVNVTYPNGTIEVIDLSNESNTIYNNSFTIPQLNGEYNLRFIANDSQNNMNATEITIIVAEVPDASISVTKTDDADPVENGTLLEYTVNISNNGNGTAYNLTLVETYDANVTFNSSVPNPDIGNTTWELGDLGAGSSTLVTITVNVNSSVLNNTLLENFVAVSYNNISDTINTNTTQNTTVFIDDMINPTLVLNSPVDLANSSSSTLNFNFTATDDISSLINCSLYFRGGLNQTNSSVVSGLSTLFSVDTITTGSFSWNVSCMDVGGNINTSETRNITVDLIDPSFRSLDYSPNDEFSLDPNVIINFTANVTDFETSVDTVILQYSLPNETGFRNLTMDFNSTTKLFNASFNASVGGIYETKLFANDTVGNSATSASVFFTALYDYNWTVNQTNLAPILANITQEITLGNILINNTGDFAINFSLNSSSLNSSYNISANFTLNASEVIYLQINETADIIGTKPVQINISANNDSVPTNSLVSGAVVVAAGQPVLVAEFIDPTSETISATLGDVGLEFVVRISNLGTGNASNVTVFFTIPSGWDVSSGSLNETFDEILIGESEDVVVGLSIPASGSTGTFSVLGNSTAVNSTGSDLGSLELIFGDSVDVVVGSPPAVLGAEESGGSTSESSAAPSSGTRSASFVQDFSSGKETIETWETIELVRGRDLSFPFRVNNLYFNSTLKDVSIDLQGYIAKYLSYSPLSIKSIEYNDFGEFTIHVEAPIYSEEGDHELIALVSGTLVIEDEYLDELGNLHKTITKKEFLERRRLKLIILDTSYDEALEVIEEARAIRDQMIADGFVVNTINRRIAEMSIALQSKEFRQLLDLYHSIRETERVGYEALDLLEQLRQRIRSSERAGLDVSQSKELLLLAESAFQREDYELTKKRARDALALQLLEAKGQFNILRFIQRFWWAILLSLAALAVLTYYLHKIALVYYINLRLRQLRVEERNLIELNQKTQKRYFEKKNISHTTYNYIIADIENKMSNMKALRARYRSKRFGLLSHSMELKMLAQERGEINNEIKQIQRDYFVKNKFGKTSYERQMDIMKQLRSDIDKAIALAHVKIEKKKRMSPKVKQKKQEGFIEKYIDKHIHSKQESSLYHRTEKHFSPEEVKPSSNNPYNGKVLTAEDLINEISSVEGSKFKETRRNSEHRRSQVLQKLEKTHNSEKDDAWRRRKREIGGEGGQDLNMKKLDEKIKKKRGRKN